MTQQIDENGAHSGSERKAHGKNKPEQGKVYALTGRSDQPSIARGDSWKKSVVTKKRLKQDAKKEEVEIDELTVDQKKKREASRERTHGGKSGGEGKGLFHGSVDSYKRQAHAADRGQKKPDSNVRKVWQKASSMRAGPQGKLPEDVEIDEGPLQDRRKAQAKKRQTLDLLRRKQAQQKMAAGQAAREKEKTDIASRRGIRAAQASKHAQKNWRAEATDIVDTVAAQISAGFDPFSHKVPRKPSRMSQKDYDYKYKATKVGKPVRNPKKNTGMKTPETQAALKYLKGKGPSPYGPGGKYEPKKEDVEIDELSKKTLGSYVKKAAPNMAINYAAGVTRVSNKRKKGINTAADKLSRDRDASMKMGSVPGGRAEEATGAKGTKKKELFKARKFRNLTPGQDRSFEKLSAARMFQAYEERTDEEMPATNTSGVANWNPLLGGKKARVYFKKRKKVDGRTKDYKETVQRVQARRDAKTARDLEQKLNMFGVSSNPFKEEIDMENNKKYLKTKDGSLEEAVLHSLLTEKFVNPNDARPTLHLPKKKYLTIKEGSLEEAVANVMTETHVPGHTSKEVKMGVGIARDPRHSGAMTRAWKKAEQIKKGLGDHPKVQKALRKAAEDVEFESAASRGERDVGSQAYTDYVKNLTPGEGDKAIVDKDAQKSAKASQEANKEKKLRTTRIDDEYQIEAGGKDYDKDGDIDSKDYLSARDNAIKRTKARIKNKIQPEETEAEYGHATALYKDQWKDRKIADYDKEHDKEKRAKEMRADAEVDRKRMWAISKNKWKHAKYSTGEEEGKRTIDGNTPTPKDAYKEDVSHNCANHVRHEEYGEGQCISGQHTIVETSEGEGYVTHYDVLFDNNQVVEDVPIEELEILSEKYHDHAPTKKKNETFSGTPNEYIEPGYGTTKWHNQLQDKEIVRKLPKGATTKATQKKQREYGQKVGGAPKGSTGDIPGAKPHKPNIGVTKEEVEIDEKDLSYKERQDMPSSQFALPGKGSGPEGKQGGSYPIPDESHARNALARVSQHGSEAEKAKVRAAVKKKFPGIKISEEAIDAVIDEVLSGMTAKDTSANDAAIAAFKKKGGVIKKIKSKGIPRYAKAAHQKMGPASAHKMYRPGSGKSEEVE